MDRQDDSERKDLGRGRQQLTEELIGAFTKLASGDFTVRIERNYTRDLEDTLAYFINLVVEEFSRAVKESEAQRIRLAEGVDELNQCFLKVAAGDLDVRAKRNETGDALDVLGFLFNTTVEELDAAFEKERHQQLILRAIFDAMTDGIILLEATGVIEHANGAIAQLAGREAAPGMRFSELVAAGDTSFAEALATEATAAFQSRETLFLDSQGQTIPLMVSGQPLNFDGKRRGMVLSLRDERDLQQARSDLQASDRMATMGMLAAGVAHEINNPMSYVISNLEFAIEELHELTPGDPIPAELHQELVKALETSKAGSERVVGIVRDLKSLSRVDEESISVVDVQYILDTAASMLRSEVRSRARLVKDYRETPPVFINEARLIQVVLNLIQNAAHAIEADNAAHNTITLSTSTSASGELLIAVADTGCGIDPEALHSVFRSFYTTKDLGVGTGLGLSICKRLVVAMGGRIEVESEVGSGSTFRVYIPRTELKASP